MQKPLEGKQVGGKDSRCPQHPPTSLYLVLNPSSRSFRGQQQWPRLFELLEASGVPFSFGITEKAGDGLSLACQAARMGYDAVLAVGGDGTINEVISGVTLATEGAPPPALGDARTEIAAPKITRNGPRARFGVVYTGTSPDFCAFHNISLDVERVLSAILTGRTRQVDLCRITHRIRTASPGEGCAGGPDGVREVDRLFSCAANFGLGAAIARGSNSGLRRRFGDSLGTFLSVLQAIARYDPPRFGVRLDGQEQTFNAVFNLFVGKSPFIASGLKLHIDMAAHDGRMYFVPLHGVSKLRLLALLPRVYTGSICRLFPPRFAQTIEILDGGSACEVEYDGDPQGILPARITVAPRALALLGATKGEPR